MIAVTHFTDPGCPWAYSASPALAVLRWRFGDALEWELVTIGLTESADQYAARGYTPGASAVGRMSFRRFGMPLAPSARLRLMATARGCRAIVATRLQHPGREDAVLRALQFAWFTSDLLMDTPTAIAQAIADVRDIDAESVVAAIESDAVTEAYEADRARARTAAGTPTEAMGRSAATDGAVRYTAPSLVFEHEGRVLDAGGFQTFEAYDVCVANLDPALPRREPAESALDAVAAFRDGLTTQEVAAIMAPRLGPVDRERAERELLLAQADESVERRPLGDDALWTPAG
jgi:predicted DsbA family dithiol-disulfide isomerase